MESSDIDVAATTRLPGLLVVSRQVRKEAIGIYHNLNTFFFIHNCDGSLIMAWAKHFRRYGDENTDETSITTRMDGSPNWDRLLRWVKWLYHNDGYYESRKPGQQPVSAVVSSAHEIV